MNSQPYNKPRILPLAWLALAFMATAALHRWCPVVTLVPNPLHWIGLIFIIPGLALLLHSGLSFIRAKTGLVPFSKASSLVTHGFFRFSRNPMYLGMVILLLGTAIYLGSVGAFPPLIVFAWIIDHQFIRNEEIFLAQTFGEDYRAYMRQVRRWI
jgi:protein-S-isoprenylcysteine O-methyltransferase Ste14